MNGLVEVLVASHQGSALLVEDGVDSDSGDPEAPCCLDPVTDLGRA